MFDGMLHVLPIASNFQLYYDQVIKNQYLKEIHENMHKLNNSQLF